MRPDIYCKPSVQTGFVSASGAPSQDFSYTRKVNKDDLLYTRYLNNYWVQIDYTFVATSAITTIEIGSKSDCGPIIDDVKLASASLIENGGFDDYAADYCKKAKCSVLGTDAIAPWFLNCPPNAGGNFKLDMNVMPNANGVASMNLAGNERCTMSQKVKLVVGKAYTLSFQLNANPKCDAKNFLSSGFVRATDAESKAFSYDSSTMKDWVKVKYAFKAISANTVIELASTTGVSCGPVIDNVELLADSTQ